MHIAAPIICTVLSLTLHSFALDVTKAWEESLAGIERADGLEIFCSKQYKDTSLAQRCLRHGYPVDTLYFESMCREVIGSREPQIVSLKRQALVQLRSYVTLEPESGTHGCSSQSWRLTQILVGSSNSVSVAIMNRTSVLRSLHLNFGFDFIIAPAEFLESWPSFARSAFHWLRPDGFLAFHGLTLHEQFPVDATMYANLFQSNFKCKQTFLLSFFDDSYDACMIAKRGITRQPAGYSNSTSRLLASPMLPFQKVPATGSINLSSALMHIPAWMARVHWTQHYFLYLCPGLRLELIWKPCNCSLQNPCLLDAAQEFFKRLASDLLDGNISNLHDLTCSSGCNAWEPMAEHATLNVSLIKLEGWQSSPLLKQSTMNESSRISIISDWFWKMLQTAVMMSCYSEWQLSSGGLPVQFVLAEEIFEIPVPEDKNSAAPVLESLLKHFASSRGRSSVHLWELGVSSGFTSSQLLKRLPWLHVDGVDQYLQLEYNGITAEESLNNYRTASERFAAFSERAHLWHMDATAAASLADARGIDVVFVDSAHTFCDTLLVLETWAPRVENSCGILAGHDWTWGLGVGADGPEVFHAIRDWHSTWRHGGSLPVYVSNSGVWWVDMPCEKIRNAS